MALDGVIAVAATQVVGVDAEVAQEGIGSIARHLRVAAVVGVAVVINPLGGNTNLVHLERLSRVGGHCWSRSAIEQRAFEVGEHLSGAIANSAQTLHDRYQAIVAKLFEFANGASVCLVI